MSQKITHDAAANMLHVTTTLPTSNEPLKITSLRGFIVNITNSEEEAEMIRQNGQSEVQLMPLLANNEQEAIDFVKSQGKVPLSVTPYEYLKFQVALLEQLSQHEGIMLINEDAH